MPVLSQARELREQRKKLAVDAQALANKPGATKEDRQNANNMLDDAAALMTQIEVLERADATLEEFRTAPPEQQPAGGPVNEEDRKKAEIKAYHAAWTKAMKYGVNSRPTAQGLHITGVDQATKEVLVNHRQRGMTPELRTELNAQLRALGQPEMRDMGSGGQGAYPGATTGFFVPVGFVQAVEEALKYYGPMLNGGPGMPRIFDTDTGQVLPYPTANDTTVTGELIGEGQQVTDIDVSLNQILFGAYKFSSRLVKVSIELLQDSAFNFDDFLTHMFGIRLGRIMNTYFTTGTGTSQPTGIVTASTLGTTAVGSSVNDGTSAGANTIGSTDLVNLEHSVDPLYRPGARFMMHDSTLRQLKTILDKYGRPLWLPGLAVRAEDTILSYGYSINNDMAQLQSIASSPTVSNKTVLFGQLEKYMIRRVRDMSVLRLEERFADTWASVKAFFSPALCPAVQ